MARLPSIIKANIISSTIVDRKLGSAILNISSGIVDGTTVTVNFTRGVAFTEGTLPNGMVITNTTTTEVAGITASVGTGTNQVIYTVTWVTDPVFGDDLEVGYTDADGDYRDADNVQMEDQTISLANGVTNPNPLTITTQPVNETVTEPNPATFSIAVSSTNPPINYQWKLNGADVTGGSGGNTDEYETGATVQGQTGNYTCEVDDASNIPISSNPATLTVNPPSGASYLTFNGTDSYGSSSSTLGANTTEGDYFAFDAMFTDTIMTFFKRGSSVQFYSQDSNTFSHRPHTGAVISYDTTGITVNDGNWHTFLITAGVGGLNTLTIDSETPITANGSTSNSSYIDLFGGDGNTVFENVAIRNVEQGNSGGAIIRYSIDSGAFGAGASESASIGSGTLTFFNVIEGDWS